MKTAFKCSDRLWMVFLWTMLACLPTFSAQENPLPNAAVRQTLSIRASKQSDVNISSADFIGRIWHRMIRRQVERAASIPCIRNTILLPWLSGAGDTVWY